MSSIERTREPTEGQDPLELDGFVARPVVVGVDGSDASGGAIRWAAVEADSSRRPLVLLLAADTEPPVPHFSAATHAPLAREVLESARSQIEPLDLGVDIHDRAVAGPPADALVEAAGHANLTVVGRRGRGTFARLLVGSTSMAVAGRADGAVVIVPESWQAMRRHDGPVVVGVDVEEPDHLALEFAHARAAEQGVDLVAVAAVEAPWTFSREPFSAREAMEDRIANYAKLLMDALRPHAAKFPHVATQVAVRQGHPAQAVIDEAHTVSADLVVLGAGRHRRFSGFPLGSVSRAVLHHADLPVTIVRPRGGEAETDE